MKILLSYLKQYRLLVFFSLLLAAINQVFSLLDPYIFRIVIDRYVSRPEAYSLHEFLRGAGLLLLAAVGVAFVSRTAKNLQDFYVNKITQKIGARIYSDGIRHSLRLPFTIFEDQRSGETLGKLEKVRTDVEKFIQAFVNTLFISLVGIIFVGIYSVSINPLIAAVYLLMIPLLGIVSSVLGRQIKKIQQHIVSETTALAGSTTESLRNIELVKSLGLTQQEIDRLNVTTEKILKLELKKIKYLRSLSFIQGTCVNLLRNCLLFFMMFLVYKGQITFGEFFSLFIYSFFIFGPLQELGNIINIYRETEVSLQHFDMLLKTPAEPQAVKAKRMNALTHLEFDHVSFRHPGARTVALHDISFQAYSGQTLAFAGPSGSGKTTLVRLLTGLYRPDSGRIFYNGISSDEIDINELRQQTGLVTQDTLLFSGTIKENLLFVNPQATDEMLLDVLHKAACQNLLARAPEGIHSIIGEGGMKISGGEKQRLAIARALLRNPSLLIFDEATSALDSITEEEITRTISQLSGNRQRITILIAHRLSTIRHADIIYVLEKGQIVESGRHNELIDQKGLYYAMWRQQAGELKTLAV
jgi:ATP-binding cassette subfamily B protein